MTRPAPPPAEPFRLILPSGPAGGLVFASPHSGTVCPADLGPAPGLAEASLRSAEDALVDRLIAAGPGHGAPVLAGLVSRAYVDLNRDPGELDPALIDDCPTAPLTARVAAGFGVLPRRTGDGADLYARRLSLAEARARLEAVHTPYHRALAGLMEAARDRNGRALLIDWHSMPSRAAGGQGRSAPGPDVVLGDRHGSACAGTTTRRLRSLFESLGWRVALNRPYAGGYSTQLWGRPDAGFEAIQIELNRALYFDEAALRPGPGFDRCRAGLERVMAGLATLRP